MPRCVEADPQESIFFWTDINQDNIDWLNFLVPNASLTFNLESLTGKHKKFNGKLGNWIEYMNDRNISARKGLDAVIRNDWYPTGGAAVDAVGGRWRVLYSLSQTTLNHGKEYP